MTGSEAYPYPSTATVDGVRKEFSMWHLTTAKSGLTTQVDSIVKVITPEAAAAVLAYAATLRGATVVEKGGAQ